MMTFAIVIVCYEKLNSLKRLISSLEIVDFQKRKDITLIFSIDYSDNNEEVRKFAENYNWEHGRKIVRKFEENQGLKKHIFSCGDYTLDYDILVVLEDDLYVSDSMYHYSYNSAKFYMDDENIAGISLYNFQKNWLNTMLSFFPQSNQYDAYFLKVAQSWGQVWTRDKWKKFKDWYSMNSEFIFSDNIPNALNKWNSKTSWLKYHDKFCIEKKKYFVYPYFSISTNFSDPGTHSKIVTSESQSNLCVEKKIFHFPVFSKESIVYDEYMERENLDIHLGLESGSLSVDIFCNKSDKQLKHKRYLLTTRKLDFKIIEQYSLALKPVELNVLRGIKGSGIYLYDTKIIEKNSGKDYRYELLKYSMGINSFRKFKSLLAFSIRGFLTAIIQKVFYDN